MSNTSVSGRSDSHRGLKYEETLRDEFDKFRSSNHSAVNNLFHFLNINKTDISRINSTTNIPPLSSGGSAKTDLILNIKFNNGAQKKIKISAKQSTKNQVSFHEYPAKTFIDVLGIQDSRTIDLFYKHQNEGSAKNFLPTEKEHFKRSLEPKKLILWEWALLGKHHTGTSEDQIVNTIICNDKPFSFEDYKRFLMGKKSGFGTGFAWTRQSRGTGKTIQLKGPVLSFYQK